MISIIIPTYNSAKTLEAAVQSVVKQTYTDKELLIIDGLSTDATLQIIEKYKKEYDFIRYVSEKDSGIYHAMNKGISLSKGDWIYFLGSDDKFIDNEILEKIFSNRSLQQFDIIYGKVYSTRWNGEYGMELTKEIVVNQNICHQAIFTKRLVFKKLGKFNLRYKGHADWDHNMKWVLSDEIPKIYIDQVIAEYGDGGFSSLYGDPVFWYEKHFNFFYYSHNSYSLGQKANFLEKLLKDAKGNKQPQLVRRIRRNSKKILQFQ